MARQRLAYDMFEQDGDRTSAQMVYSAGGFRQRESEAMLGLWNSPDGFAQRQALRQASLQGAQMLRAAVQPLRRQLHDRYKSAGPVFSRAYASVWGSIY
jgi:hypothetical protein